MDQFCSERQGLLEQLTSSIRLSVNGMTCQSCVRNIESNVKEKPGIFTIKVDLQEKAAYIDYDPQITDPKQIASDIESMGFECEYIATDDNDEIAAKIVQNNKTKRVKENIHIDGMKCGSCVKNIEEQIGCLVGIKTIKVDLEQKEATVEYDNNILSVQEIVEKICDMGFSASLQTDSSYKQQPLGS